ncbi:MAG: glycosyltransferase, partial [Candidatus Moranbacteria bacterium]|nr:glycosyltransferase [Candidatus Moranbacteria bacterium]
MKILIIIPAYNEEENVRNVIESIVRQDKSFDMLVVNDGSSDNTKEVAEGSGIA